MPEKNLIRAASRYKIVAEVLAKVAKGEALSSAIVEITKNKHLDHNGRTIRLSKRNLYRWVAAFQKKGLDGLCDKPRTMKTPSLVLPPRFLDFMAAEKEGDNDASIPEIIRRAEQQKIIKTENDVSRSSVWRAARRMNLPIFADKGVTKGNMRRFAYAHRMQMVISDGKHFRAGIKRVRRVVMSFLDDSSRFGLRVVVGPTESTELFIRGLWESFRQWGKFISIFLDNGSGFISSDTYILCARLGVNLIHGTVRYPEGHGKIERYHGTLIQDLLRSFDGNVDIDPSCMALEMRINHYLSEVYNRRPHESLDKISPEEKFLGDTLPLQPMEDEQRLRQKLIVWRKRKVTRDNIVPVKRIFYEVPSGYAGRRVWVRRHLLDGTVFFPHEGKLVELQPVDVISNAENGAQRSPKRHKKDKEPTVTTPSKTAATMQFEKDYGPIVSPEGDFYKQDKEK